VEESLKKASELPPSQSKSYLQAFQMTVGMNCSQMDMVWCKKEGWTSITQTKMERGGEPGKRSVTKLHVCITGSLGNQVRPQRFKLHSAEIKLKYIIQWRFP